MGKRNLAVLALIVGLLLIAITIPLFDWVFELYEYGATPPLIIFCPIPFLGLILTVFSGYYLYKSNKQE